MWSDCTRIAFLRIILRNKKFADSLLLISYKLATIQIYGQTNRFSFQKTIRTLTFKDREKFDVISKFLL